MIAGENGWCSVGVGRVVLKDRKEEYRDGNILIFLVNT